MKHERAGSYRMEHKKADKVYNFMHKDIQNKPNPLGNRKLRREKNKTR
jgi:hypothetical protein